MSNTPNTISHHDGLLDLLRWVSALCVVVTHVRSFVILPFEHATRDIFANFFYFVTGFGHQAVVVFFVISGYLVSTSARKALQKDQVKQYMIGRFARIYTVLLPCLVITFFLDSIGARLYPELYSNKLQFSALDFNIMANLNLYNAIFNLLNLQGIVSNSFGSNSPLWSLSIEWWCYILYPLLISKLTNKLFAIAIILFFSFYEASFGFYGAIWLMGSIASTCKRTTLAKFPFSLSVLIFILSLLYSRFVSSWTADLSIGLAVAILLISSSHQNFQRSSILLKINNNFAAFSFTTYAFHFPLLLFIISISNYYNFNVLSRSIYDQGGVIFVLFVYCLLFISTYLYRIFEQKTTNFRKFLTRIFVP